MKLILSLIGTSILTNRAEPEFRRQIIQSSNLKEDEIDKDFKNRVLELKIEVIEFLETADIVQKKKSCAELNSIISIYENIERNDNDIHILIGTDTFMAGIAMDIVENYLRKNGILTIIPEVVKSLNTKSIDSFSNGIINLLHFLDEAIPKYKEKSYEIFFNLTAGFKSLQGFLNSIGTFYADKIFYIFESGELIEIPKLPISISDDIFRNNASKFLLLAQEHFLSDSELSGIPKTLLFKMDDNNYGISPWGLLVWNNVKQDIFKENLIELPRLKYENTFEKDYGKITDNNEKTKLQETLARVSSILLNEKEV